MGKVEQIVEDVLYGEKSNMFEGQQGAFVGRAICADKADVWK